MSSYAIIQTGGQQYRVAPGDVIDVERIKDHEPGDTVSFDEVLLVSDGNDVSVGTPFVTGARVVAKVEEEGKGKKIIVFKYKPKIRYRRKKGHRQRFARLSIQEIESPVGSEAKVKQAGQAKVKKS